MQGYWYFFLRIEREMDVHAPCRVSCVRQCLLSAWYWPSTSPHSYSCNPFYICCHLSICTIIMAVRFQAPYRAWWFIRHRNATHTASRCLHYNAALSQSPFLILLVLLCVQFRASSRLIQKSGVSSQMCQAPHFGLHDSRARDARMSIIQLPTVCFL